MSKFIRSLNGSGWAPLNRKALDDARLSISARGVLAWLCSRPDDHQVVLSYALTRWDITQPTWARIRDELVAAGYLKVERAQQKGRFVWTFHLTDSPSSPPLVDHQPLKNEAEKGGFEDAMKELDGEFQEWKFVAGSRRKGSITAWHIRKNCIPQLQKLFERGGVEAMRSALHKGIANGLRDFSSIL